MKFSFIDDIATLFVSEQEGRSLFNPLQISGDLASQN